MLKNFGTSSVENKREEKLQAALALDYKEVGVKVPVVSDETYDQDIDEETLEKKKKMNEPQIDPVE